MATGGFTALVTGPRFDGTCDVTIWHGTRIRFRTGVLADSQLVALDTAFRVFGRPIARKEAMPNQPGAFLVHVRNA